MCNGEKTLFPADLRQKLSPDFIKSLDPAMKREVVDLLEDLQSFEIRRHLIDWSRLAGFEPAAHHRLLIEKLEAVASGAISRLAVFMPPGSAKSTYSSILFPPWYLANNPTAAIIAASHTTELAEKWGRRFVT